jgi:hypothetical protein
MMVFFMAVIAFAGPLFVAALALLCFYVLYHMFVDILMDYENGDGSH